MPGPRRTGKDKTSVVFSVKDRPGVLKDALSAFAEEGINLTRIESRPSRKRAWTYVFFADFLGHAIDVRAIISNHRDFYQLPPATMCPSTTSR